MAELKPCPFCGGEARRYNGDIHGHGVVCNKCSAKVNGYLTQSGATRAWQRRVQNEQRSRA